LKEPIKWVINPSSRLAIQDAQVAYVAIPSVPTLTGEPTTLPLNFAENGFTFSEGKDAVSGKWQYRTEYVDINCLGNDHNFNFYYPISPAGGAPKIFLKFILNLKKLDDPTGQNVLLVVTFPIINESTQSASIVPALQKFNPLSCIGGRIVQATGSDVNTFCLSTTYRTNRVRRVKPNDVLISQTEKEAEINVYPNPTDNHFNVKFGKEIFVKDITLVNALSQTVWNKKYNVKANSLNFVTNKNQNGYYTLKINTGFGTINKKVFIKSN
jgi:hypothetical protein